MHDVVGDTQVTYTWDSPGWSGIPAGYTLKNVVLPPPVPAEAGQTYKLRLTARFTGSTAAATADVALTAVGSPLSASLLGPSGDVMGDRDIVLDASKSLDPDDPKVRVASAFRVMTESYCWVKLYRISMSINLPTCRKETSVVSMPPHGSLKGKY
jgi:hypothetical protein